MKISVKVKTKAREESVEKIRDREYAVSVKESPVDGKANIAVIKALAEYFQVPSSRVRIHAGHGSKGKVVEIL